jgi:fido (protein-threonine AMPylation protein)
LTSDDEASPEHPRLPILDLNEWGYELQHIPAIRREIDRNIIRLARWIDAMAPSRILDGPLILKFHQTLFDGVLPTAAGRLRGPAPTYIPWDVTFGNYRGERFQNVPGVCAVLFERVEHWIRELDRMRGQHDQRFIEDQALQVAAYVHCELVRIHPFIDGNGRTARACVNYFGRRYGGRMPLPFHRGEDDEYRDAQRTYLQFRVSDHFADYLRSLWPTEHK